MRKSKIKPPTDAAPVTSYKHTDTRVRIPTQEESQVLAPREKRPIKKVYQYDPSLDPQLNWAGKVEQGSQFGVSTVPIYQQEKIAPEAIIARLKQGASLDTQLTFLGTTATEQFEKAVSFYEHEDNWQNRMILGDSLLVMNSLLEKERMRGKVQCIYIDPPYGIKFGSNWQVSTRNKEVKDNKVNDFIRQPEQVKAFRDTWELGIHSYISYLRDRLIVSRELLTESGSCFVQINEENVHLVRNLLDEVVGGSNFISQIFVQKTGGFTPNYLPSIGDYVIWYGKDKNHTKYRQLYSKQDLPNKDDPNYVWLELSDGTVRKMTTDEKDRHVALPDHSRIFRYGPLQSDGKSNTDQKFVFDGKEYLPSGNSHWKTTIAGLQKLADKKLILKSGSSLAFKLYWDFHPFSTLTNIWLDTQSGGFNDPKVYVVQTTTKTIQRCILMTTDPGDIVLDPTCGSGTTAYVAEQWGRRWITIDTSRVALALARTRLMTAKYPYYLLKDENIRNGFVYKSVPHITLKSLANDEPADQEILYDQPIVNNDIVRVSGPLTVESLSPHRVSDAQEMLSSENFVETVVSNLLKSGVQTGKREERMEFVNLDILPSGPEVQAVGEFKSVDGLKKVAVSIGPEFGSIDDDFIRDAASVAKRFANVLVVAGTSFEASAFSEPSDVNGLRVMKVKINPDLSMGDLLKKTGSGNLFLAFGDPDVRVRADKEGYVVEVMGVDVYDPVKSEIRSSGSGDPEHEIAAWFIDVNYDGKAFFVTQAYFPGGNNPFEKLKKALKVDINEEVWDSLCSTVSRAFAKPSTGKIAVKVINHYGDEAMRVIEVH